MMLRSAMWLLVAAILPACTTEKSPREAGRESPGHGAVWDEAKERGVDFRATGNEPGWYLELTDGGGILMVADYGERRHQFETPRPERDSRAARTTYRVRQGGHELVIVLEDRACFDSMSGAEFDTAVTATLDGAEYRGCGRRLD